LIRRILLFACIACLLAIPVSAQTINASSCSANDIADALGSIASDGAVVVVPSGDCTWGAQSAHSSGTASVSTAGQLTYTQTNSFTLQGAGAIYFDPSNISGQGSDLTTIENNITSGSNMFAVTTITGKSFRMTGFHWKWHSGNSNGQSNGWVQVGGVSTSVRVDHNHFDQMNNVDLQLQGCVRGVVDHNQFDTSYGSETPHRFQSGSCTGDTQGFGDGTWASASGWGTSDFVFAELNNYQTVSGTNAGYPFDCSKGGKFVWRFNHTGNYQLLVTHGTGNSSDGSRGCRAGEAYGNTMVYSADPTDHNATLIQAESGGYYWWGNTLTGYYGVFQADIVRTNEVTYTQGTPPAGWGYCGTTYGPSNWDENNDSTGYACLDGIGRGGGDILQGTLTAHNRCDATLSSGTPGACGSGVYTGVWPNQALDPVYVWSNVQNAVPDRTNHYWVNYPTPTAVTENQDYYLEQPNVDSASTFDGTKGVGCGPSSSPSCTNNVARPATCTKGVAYWNESEGSWNTSGNGFGSGRLYICTSTNTWTLSYTPYTFPHPLDTGTQAATPTFNPGGESHSGSLTVTMSSTSGTVICHGTGSSPATNGDGSTCSIGSAITTNSGTNCVASSTVCGDITVSTTQTQYAVAGSASLTDSNIQSAAYTILSASQAGGVASGVGLASGTAIKPYQ